MTEMRNFPPLLCSRRMCSASAWGTSLGYPRAREAAHADLVAVLDQLRRVRGVGDLLPQSLVPDPLSPHHRLAPFRGVQEWLSEPFLLSDDAFDGPVRGGRDPLLLLRSRLCLRLRLPFHSKQDPLKLEGGPVGDHRPDFPQREVTGLERLDREGLEEMAEPVQRARPIVAQGAVDQTGGDVVPDRPLRGDLRDLVPGLSRRNRGRPPGDQSDQLLDGEIGPIPDRIHGLEEFAAHGEDIYC